MSTSSRGNKKLTKSVGLITADEATYAGAFYGQLSKYYLDNNSYWWSVSPSYFNGTYAYELANYPGGDSGSTNTTSSWSVRPVVSLKADTVVLGGSGSSNDPYIITQ